MAWVDLLMVQTNHTKGSQQGDDRPGKLSVLSTLLLRAPGRSSQQLIRRERYVKGNHYGSAATDARLMLLLNLQRGRQYVTYLCITSGAICAVHSNRVRLTPIGRRCRPSVAKPAVDFWPRPNRGCGAWGMSAGLPCSGAL